MAHETGTRKGERNETDDSGNRKGEDKRGKREDMEVREEERQE